MIGENIIGQAIFILSVVILIILWIILVTLYINRRKKNKRNEEKATEVRVETPKGLKTEAKKGELLNVATLGSLFSDQKLAASIAMTLKVPVNQSIEEADLLTIKELNAEYSGIKNLEGIGKLRNLEKLNVNNNDIQLLPLEMNQLAKLEKIQVAYNQLGEFIPPLKDNKVLKSIDVSGNKLTNLPPDVFALPQLQEFVAINSGIATIPTEIGTAANLETLNLSHNELGALPMELASLEKLKRCNFSYNNITEVPEEISNLSTLEEFDVSRNGAIDIPQKVIEQLKTQSILLPTQGEDLNTEIDGGTNMAKLVNTYIDLTSSNENLLEDLKELEGQGKGETAFIDDGNVELGVKSALAEAEGTVSYHGGRTDKKMGHNKKKRLIFSIGSAVGVAMVATASVAYVLLANKKK
ncbi:MAG: leucine-rich repeat domain-containing protein [Culicoidibacterales bacterium]